MGLLAPSLPASAAEPTPLVVAVDTSRSLDAAALGRVSDRLRLALEALPADTPTALLAFDDEPRWVEELGASPARVSEQLRRLDLQGNYTLLNDALFFATRALPDGGVVLLATDGRDENSAVVVDDIARRCEEQDVRIVSVGTGRAVEEKALRRLALLSNGAYLGEVEGVAAAELADAVKQARAEVSQGRRQAREGRASASGPANGSPAAPANPGAASPGAASPGAASPGAASPVGGSGGVGPAGSAASGPETSAGAPPWQSPLLIGAIAAVLLFLVFFLLRGRSRPDTALMEEDQAALERREQEAADEAEAGMIRVELAQVEAATPREAPEVTVDTAVYQQMSLDERLETTRVLSNHGMLIMRKHGERPRSFMLDRAKAFAVGRDRHKNTLAVPDPALSSQHFKIVPRDEDQYFVDLESTNGSYVNGRPVSAKRLQHGDVIRAGQVEFEYQSYSNI